MYKTGWKNVVVFFFFFWCSQVGVKIEASSFSLTRIVTFVPFYMLVNRTKHRVFICEEGQESWTEAEPEQVRSKRSTVHVQYMFWHLFNNRIK